jgi:hypothetical protein
VGLAVCHVCHHFLCNGGCKCCLHAIGYNSCHVETHQCQKRVQHFQGDVIFLSGYHVNYDVVGIFKIVMPFLTKKKSERRVWLYLLANFMARKSLI